MKPTERIPLNFAGLAVVRGNLYDLGRENPGSDAAQRAFALRQPVAKGRLHPPEQEAAGEYRDAEAAHGSPQTGLLRFWRALRL